ncbi:MFS transporter [Euzebya tangerina]|uniref:MFS transporter n=1 Tax=Euzebya tangerina TaxID=591198 RepID=UPI00196B7A20|nr:MFS transporter [Euzebya tangerina]
MTTPTPVAHSAQADPDGRWRALAILSIAMVLAMTTWFSAAAVLPQLRDVIGISDAQGGLLTIAVQLGFVTGALISAATNLADLLPARRLVLLGTIGAAVANLGLLVIDSFTGAVAVRFAVGVSLAGVYGPSLKAMATWFRAGRGTALGVMVGALTLGSATPHLVNGIGGADWRTVIVATSVLTVLGGVIAEVGISDGPFPFPRTVFDPTKLGLVFTNRKVRLASMGYFGHMWELYAMWAWFAVFYADVVDDNTRTAALATFAVIGIGALGSWVGGVISDRMGRTTATTIAMLCSGAMALVVGALVDASPALVLALGLFWGFWVVADSAQFSALVTEHADQRYVGTAVTMQLAIGFTLTVITIWLVPLVRDASGWWLAFAILVPGPALGVWAMQRLRRLPAGT